MAASWLRPSWRLTPVVPLLALFAQADALSCTSAEGAPEHVAPDGPAPAAHADADDPVRIKGLAPHLVLHRKRASAIERLETHAMAHAGDLVQISYVAAGNSYGVIVSLDDRGVVTLHHPHDLRSTPRILPRGEHPLAHAYELDDAAGFERFFFVNGGEFVVDAVEVIDATHALSRSHDDAAVGPLRLPSGWQQSSVYLAKAD